MNVTARISISRPREDVFDFITNPENAHVINPGVRLRAASPCPLAEGNTYEQVLTQPSGAEIARTCTVIALTPGQSVSTEVRTASGATIIEKLDLSDAGEATLVRYTSQVRPHGWFAWILYPAMLLSKSRIQRYLSQALARAKLHLERGA